MPRPRRLAFVATAESRPCLTPPIDADKLTRRLGGHRPSATHQWGLRQSPGQATDGRPASGPAGFRRRPAGFRRLPGNRLGRRRTAGFRPASGPPCIRAFRIRQGALPRRRGPLGEAARRAVVGTSPADARGVRRAREAAGGGRPPASAAAAGLRCDVLLRARGARGVTPSPSPLSPAAVAPPGGACRRGGASALILALRVRG